jgi:hypothetical protein
MRHQIKVDLNRVNTSNALDLGCAVKNALVVGYNQPNICAALYLPKRNILEQSRGWIIS